MLKGSCMCGSIRYEAEGPLSLVACCHCVQCRKASGAEFATNGNVPAATFRVVAGAELLSSFSITPGKARHFCARCGSPLFKKSEDSPDVVRLRLGALDTDEDVHPVAHAFVSEKPRWSVIHDDLPQFPRLPERPR